MQVANYGQGEGSQGGGGRKKEKVNRRIAQQRRIRLIAPAVSEAAGNFRCGRAESYELQHKIGIDYPYCVGAAPGVVGGVVA